MLLGVGVLCYIFISLAVVVTVKCMLKGIDGLVGEESIHLFHNFRATVYS